MRTHARRMMIAHERAAAHRPTSHAHRAEIGDPITLAVAAAWVTTAVIDALAAIGVGAALAALLAPWIVGAIISAGLAGGAYVVDRCAEMARGESDDAKFAQTFQWDSGFTTQAAVDAVCKNLIATMGKDRGVLCSLKVQGRWTFLLQPAPLFISAKLVGSLDELKAISGEMGSGVSDDAIFANRIMTSPEFAAGNFDGQWHRDADVLLDIFKMQQRPLQTFSDMRDANFDPNSAANHTIGLNGDPRRRGMMVGLLLWHRWKSVVQPRVERANRESGSQLDAQGKPLFQGTVDNPSFDYSYYPPPTVYTRATGPAASNLNRLLSSVTLLPRDYKTGKLVPPPAPPPPAAAPLPMLPAKLPPAPISAPAKVAVGISGASIVSALLFALLRRM